MKFLRAAWVVPKALLECAWIILAWTWTNRRKFPRWACALVKGVWRYHKREEFFQAHDARREAERLDRLRNPRRYLFE